MGLFERRKVSFDFIVLPRCSCSVAQKPTTFRKTSKEGTSVYKTAFLDVTVVRGELY